MRRLLRSALPALGVLATAATTAHAQFTIYGVTTSPTGGQQLVSFNSAAPTAVTTIGLTGTTLTGIDVRPATGGLYGYNGSSLFTLNLLTGAATRVATVGASTSGTNVGFDFNPTVDRIRITDATGTNLRVNPIDGSATIDGTLTYAAGDPGAGATPTITGVGYTNNDTDPATGTTIYGIDATRGTLVTSANPNGGIYTTVGSLGLGSVSQITGFDIVTVGGVNTAFLAVLGGSGSLVSSLYQVNLASGATTLLGSIGVTGGIQGLAVVPSATTVPEPTSLALVAGGVALATVVTRRRRQG